jgi:hypothetical protein
MQNEGLLKLYSLPNMKGYKIKKDEMAAHAARTRATRNRYKFGADKKSWKNRPKIGGVRA